jgi:hypothetical protein
MKKIILIIIAVLIFSLSSGIGYAQIELTERELLIQLNEKVTYINESALRIEKNLITTTEKANTLESRVTVTEQGIISLCNKIEGLTGSWNWTLGLFGILIISVTAYIWKGIYGNRKTNNKTNQVSG